MARVCPTIVSDHRHCLSTSMTRLSRSDNWEGMHRVREAQAFQGSPAYSSRQRGGGGGGSAPRMGKMLAHPPLLGTPSLSAGHGDLPIPEWQAPTRPQLSQMYVHPVYPQLNMARSPPFGSARPHPVAADAPALNIQHPLDAPSTRDIRRATPRGCIGQIGRTGHLLKPFEGPKNAICVQNPVKMGSTSSPCEHLDVIQGNPALLSMKDTSAGTFQVATSGPNTPSATAAASTSNRSMGSASGTRTRKKYTRRR